MASAFSGIYTPAGFDPPPETLSYRSYITYVVGGIRILYATSGGLLGTATAGIPHMKILGQHNLPSRSNGGIGEKNTENFWNLLHKKTALL